jgi:hypothetical protein
MELEANPERMYLFNEIILRFGPPDKQYFTKAFGLN